MIVRPTRASKSARKSLQRISPALLLALSLPLFSLAAHAEDGWKPFAEKDNAAAKRAGQPPAALRQTLPPMSDAAGVSGAPSSSTGAPTFAGPAPDQAGALSLKASTVERGELAPIIAADGSGLPLELWNGLDVAGIEANFARLSIPPRSTTVNGLWRRLLQAEAVPTGGNTKFQALRAEAFGRSGMLKEQAETLGRLSGDGQIGAVDAIILASKARSDLINGRNETGCAAAKDAGARKADLPKRLNGDVIVLTGYCAALAGNAAAAGLAAELAREEGYDAPVAIAALDAIALGPDLAVKQKIAIPKSIDPIDYRLLQMTLPPELSTILERADPALLSLLVADTGTDPKLRIAAAEAASRLNIIAPDALADVYRAQQFSAVELTDALTGKPDPLFRRALLFKATEAERTPQRKTRVIRALLDDAKRLGLYVPMLRIVAKPIAALQRQIEIGWFAETAVEAMLTAERYDDARLWATFGQGLDRPATGPATSGLQHWLALIDIADPGLKVTRGQSLASVEQMALAGRFTPEMLHRLATVLDALDYQVPIPLWEAASKTPQPNTGHLPETGVLTELQDAAKKKEFARTVLLTLRTVGTGGAEGAHIIALGDAIRGLKRAGLEPDARRLGFEALFVAWPRAASN